jgi:hypothetical protein
MRVLDPQIARWGITAQKELKISTNIHVLQAIITTRHSNSLFMRVSPAVSVMGALCPA